MLSLKCRLKYDIKLQPGSHIIGFESLPSQAIAELDEALIF